MSDSNVAVEARSGIGLVTVILALIFLFVWPGSGTRFVTLAPGMRA